MKTICKIGYKEVDIPESIKDSSALNFANWKIGELSKQVEELHALITKSQPLMTVDHSAPYDVKIPSIREVDIDEPETRKGLTDEEYKRAVPFGGTLDTD